MKITENFLKSAIVAALGTAFMAGLTSPALGQTFNSGSTGADGAFTPSCAPTPCTVTLPLPPSGVFNYTTVTVPAGVTVRYTRNAANTPVTILASGDVAINGTLSVNGNNGVDGGGIVITPGGLGGPGGFNGGNGGIPGGPRSSAGQGPGGGDIIFNVIGVSGNYGAPDSFVSLIPLFGGSGGGGNAAGGPFDSMAGASGAGGGGAIVIASSSRVVVDGAITANSGIGGGGGRCSGSGSGGAIRVVARQISGAGSLQVFSLPNPCTSGGGPGRIRLEAFSLAFSGSTSTPGQNVTPSQVLNPGPIGLSSNPALIALPTIAITSVGGATSPATPGGSYTSADVSVPQGTTNPVPVVVTATNTPVGASTAITVRLIPSSGAVTTVTATQSGTFASSTATVNVTFPSGKVSVLQAWATMTLTGQIASLFPFIDGEPVERVMIASVGSGPSSLSFIGKSGKETRFDQLRPDEQLKVAQAWHVLRETQSQ